MKKILFSMMLLFGLLAAPLSASACHYASDYSYNSERGCACIWIYDTNTFETVAYIYITYNSNGRRENGVTYNGKTVIRNGARHQLFNTYINIYKEIELDDDCMRQALTQQSNLYGIDIIKKNDDLRIDGCFDRYGGLDDRFGSFEEAGFIK